MSGLFCEIFGYFIRTRINILDEVSRDAEKELWVILQIEGLCSGIIIVIGHIHDKVVICTFIGYTLGFKILAYLLHRPILAARLHSAYDLLSVCLRNLVSEFFQFVANSLS